MNPERTREYVDRVWTDSILPTLHEYVRIPNQSPTFDPRWQEHGYMEQAVSLAADWVGSRQIPGSRLEVLRLEGRTPVLLLEVDGSVAGTVLLARRTKPDPTSKAGDE